MDKRIKGLVDELFELSASVCKTTVNGRKENADKIEETTREEAMNFLMYLSASDGSIEVKEAIFIKDYFGEQLSPEEMCNHIEENDIYSAAFERKAPSILKKIVRADNAIYEKNGDLEESKGERYICVYEALGSEFIACDREVSQCEREDLNTYITNMRSFYRANYKGPEKATKVAHRDYVAHGSRNGRNDHKGKASNNDGEESLEELLEQMNALIGLERVKGTVSQLIHFNSIRHMRDERGLAQLPITQHMVFYGNPGTGKTTVARLIAKIYHHLGILSKGHLVEVDRSGLVAGYVGHTALKVKDVVKQAKGGVLFIDEAYALTYKRSENDFGWEAVDTLIKAMEDERDDLVVIVAGYPEPMAQFINSNPGLKSRFNRYIFFDDYDGDQLFEIYQKMMKEAGYRASQDTLEDVKAFFYNKAENKKEDTAVSIGFGSSPFKKAPSLGNSTGFANARLVRNFLETAIMNQADRLYAKGGELSDEELLTLEEEDVECIA